MLIEGLGSGLPIISGLSGAERWREKGHVNTRYHKLTSRVPSRQSAAFEPLKSTGNY